MNKSDSLIIWMSLILLKLWKLISCQITFYSFNNVMILTISRLYYSLWGVCLEICIEKENFLILHVVMQYYKVSYGSHEALSSNVHHCLEYM